MVYDTETANGLDDPIMYDCGGAIVDKNGKVYETFSLIIDEISTIMFQTNYVVVDVFPQVIQAGQFAVPRVQKIYIVALVRLVD
jgi:hypothetical protein